MKLEKSKVYVLYTLLMLFLLSNITIFSEHVTMAADFSTTRPVVFVDPLEIILDEMTVGQNFTISVKIFNVTNLYGIDLQFGWNSSVLKYLNHTKMIPVETYPDGILHSPTVPVKDQVDESASMPGSAPGTMYWLAEASLDPAQPFDGTAKNCTIFTMSFQVLMLEESPLEITSCTLADRGGHEISHQALSGKFRHSTETDFSFYPDIAVTNKIVYFNASVSENATNVDQYIWNFGDGTPPQNVSVPEWNHTYTAAGSYTVSLKVKTLDGKESSVTSKSVTVVDIRDLAVLEISSLHWGVYKNLTSSFKAKIANFGNITEECTAIAYFNVTAVNKTNLTETVWVAFDNMTMSLSKEPQYFELTFNASIVPTFEAYYYILVNATGIPQGYDANDTNNFLISDTPIFVTENIIHDALIEDFKYGYMYKNLFAVPISGEDVTFQIKVKNNGTYLDAINATLYINETYAYGWPLTKALAPGELSTLQKWTTNQTQAGHYNVTIVVSAGDKEAILSVDLHVLLPPQLTINYSPENPIANQSTILLDASTSFHRDPEGNITEYRWRIYAPYPNGSAIEDLEKAVAFLSIKGNIVNFTAPMNGNWTIVLAVADNFGLEYSALRPATSPYRTQAYIWVGEAKPQEGWGFPIEYIAITFIIIVAVVIAGTLILQKKRRLKTPTEK